MMYLDVKCKLINVNIMINIDVNVNVQTNGEIVTVFLNTQILKMI